ncbi:hypothetical protein BDQ17DRAFT_1345964 [Cyathus striatus]|nr:hypothetical protein BDQ17DRAFT_1345964 [Cyathus striatus]
MSPESSIEVSALASVICNVILYGSYSIIFPICMLFLIRSRLKGIPVHWVLFLAIISQFFISTIYLSAQLHMAFHSFVGFQATPSALSPGSPTSTVPGPQSIVPEPSPTWWRDTPPPASVNLISEPVLSVSGWAAESKELSPIALYWLDKTLAVQIFSNITCFMNVIIGDMLLIWRVYFVWGKQWRMCLPSLASLIPALVCTIIMFCRESTIIYSDTSNLAGAAWAFSIGTQIMSTSLISFRIWQAGHSTALKGRVSQPGAVNNPYKKLLWIIIESGALYSAVAMALLICYSTRRMDAAMVLMTCTGQISAIIPASIIIFVHLNLVPTSTHSNNNTKIVFASYGSQSTNSTQYAEKDASVWKDASAQVA